MELTLDTTIKRNDDLLVAEVNDEIVMMSISSGQYYGLDEVGIRIWKMLDQPKRIDYLCDELGKEYAVSPTQCQDDVLKFVNDMAAHKLVFVTD